MPPRLIVRKKAESDIDAAFAWYEFREPGLGLRSLQEVDTAFDTIEAQPRLFASIHHDVRRALLKKFPFGVYYVHREAAVVVIAVMHAARHPNSWQRRV